MAIAFQGIVVLLEVAAKNVLVNLRNKAPYGFAKLAQMGLSASFKQLLPGSIRDVASEISLSGFLLQNCTLCSLLRGA